MKPKHITITGLSYHGDDRFLYRPGRVFKCVKEKENHYDEEAIGVQLEGIKIRGYVANSVNTVAKGTMSAGRIYDKTDNEFDIIVRFVTRASVICEVIEETEK